ncbi:hypothetical protein DXT74_11065 [Chromobacterium sp. Rain0013]|nr:hypothetical protein DXT74_11065 [Chromobacterium sp. Rain0013]
MLRALKPRSKVAIIGGLPGSINAKARSDGYREAIASAILTLTALAWGRLGTVARTGRGAS